MFYDSINAKTRAEKVPGKNAGQTRGAAAGTARRPLFEAGFVYSDGFARVDILDRYVWHNQTMRILSSASTPLTGYCVAVVNTSPVWVVGSAQNRFGIEECSYWTDSAGRAIPWPASRVKQPGDRQQRYTRFRLGQVSVSIPLPPIDFACLTGFVALAFGCILITRFTRGRTQTNDEPIKV